MTIIFDTSSFEVGPVWASEQLHHVDVVIVTTDNCDKFLTADSLNLIFATKPQIILRAEDLLDAHASQVNNKAMTEFCPIISSKARDLVLI